MSIFIFQGNETIKPDKFEIDKAVLTDVMICNVYGLKCDGNRNVRLESKRSQSLFLACQPKQFDCYSLHV